MAGVIILGLLLAVYTALAWAGAVGKDHEACQDIEHPAPDDPDRLSMVCWDEHDHII
jgi:hypothetical protein